MNRESRAEVFDFETGMERTLEHRPGQLAPLHGDPEASRPNSREAQVFACLAKALAEGPHREFVREVDRSA